MDKKTDCKAEWNCHAYNLKQGLVKGKYIY